MDINRNYEDVKQRIKEACMRSGRNPDDVQVIAVTKYASYATTAKALDAGVEHVGESKVQDAVPKWEDIGNRGAWHFIGHLQSNKAKDIIGRFSYIHSLDRLSLAKELQKRASKQNQKVKCFVQVNVSGEESKNGLSKEKVLPFLEKVREMDAVEVVGLMTMAPLVQNPEETRDVFKQLRELKEKINISSISGIQLEHLSMGMSNDFEVAVEEGATFVRIGSILVGNELKGNGGG